MTTKPPQPKARNYTLEDVARELSCSPVDFYTFTKSFNDIVERQGVDSSELSKLVLDVIQLSKQNAVSLLEAASVGGTPHLADAPTLEDLPINSTIRNVIFTAVTSQGFTPFHSWYPRTESPYVQGMPVIILTVSGDYIVTKVGHECAQYWGLYPMTDSTIAAVRAITTEQLNAIIGTKDYDRFISFDSINDRANQSL